MIFKFQSNDILPPAKHIIQFILVHAIRYALIKIMKIANERTFEEFDRLKEQLTAHKRKSSPKPNHVKSPINGRFRWILPLFLMAGGGWLAYRNTPTLQDYLLSSGRITYQESLAWSSIQTYLHCKWLQLTTNHKITPSKTLANQCYITRLESDLLYLTERAPEKKLYIETRSNYSMGIFSWGNTQKIRYVNPYGDLVEKNRTSKLMLGNLLRIWGKTTEKLIKRERIFGFYQRQFGQIGNQCERVNWLAQWQLSKQQHELSVQHCQAESRRVSDKLRRLVEERLKKEKKMYKQ